MTTTAQRVTIEQLSKSFTTLRGRTEVLRELSLSIGPGEFFVLLGPSGCGKSTLLNLIAGLEKPTAGTIRIADRLCADAASGTHLEPFQRDVAMVFQSYALYPHMTVEQNIAFPLTNQRPRPSMQDLTARVQEIASLLHIESLLDRKPSELSGGQRQRVAIGRAIVRKPSLFLMDEPLSNLDAQLRTVMRAQLKELQKRLGITTVYVTHDQMEAMTLGDRIAILDGGVIQQLDTPKTVYDHPANRFVARFVGSPPMNVMSGALVQKVGSAVFRIEGAEISVPSSEVEKITAGPGSDVWLGIRPELIGLAEPAKGHVRGEITVSENLGSEYLHYVAVAGVADPVVVRSAAAAAESEVGLVFPAEHVRLFDKQVG